MRAPAGLAVIADASSSNGEVHGRGAAGTCSANRGPGKLATIGAASARNQPIVSLERARKKSDKRPYAGHRLV